MGLLSSSKSTTNQYDQRAGASEGGIAASGGSVIDNTTPEAWAFGEGVVKQIAANTERTNQIVIAALERDAERDQAALEGVITKALPVIGVVAVVIGIAIIYNRSKR